MQVIIYCEKCGATPGAPSNCSVIDLGAATHSFVHSDVPVVCKHCGAAPGLPTRCNIVTCGAASHSFVKVTSLLRR